MMIKTMIDAHRFFVAESRNYVGPYTWSDRLMYPVAYCRFMRLMYMDARKAA